MVTTEKQETELKPREMRKLSLYITLHVKIISNAMGQLGHHLDWWRSKSWSV